MSKKKPVTVTIRETNRKADDQPFTVEIDKPGKAEPYKLKQRYTTPATARRGALRNLNACTVPGKHDGRNYRYATGYAWQTPDGIAIEVVIKRRK